MALSEYKEQFDDSYETHFQKVAVSPKVANFRFEGDLSYGDKVARVRYNFEQVEVRDITIGVDRTIDPIVDTRDSIDIDNIKGTTFRLSDVEKIQAGPLNPAQRLGKEMATKMQVYIDADFFNEVKNANNTFDTGNLTTLVPTGVPIDLSTTTVPQMVARMPAALRSRENQDLKSGTFSFVIDAYGFADIEEYILNKQIDISQSVFENGYVGDISTGARVYVSENLAADAVLTMATNPSNTETITINGFTYTFVSTIGTAEGNVLIEATVDATRDNLVAAINEGAGAGTKYVAWTNASPTYLLSNWRALRLTAVDADATDTISISGIGSGRLIFGGTATYTETSNYIHSYYGRNGAIDLVVQKGIRMEDSRDQYQFADIIKTEALYGLKTFEDGSRQFLDVWIKA
jgi:hypothetical protein